MKKQFFTGLALLLPLIITIWIVGFVINLLTKPFMGVMTGILETLPLSHSDAHFLQSREILLQISRILILLLLFVTIVAVGWLTQWYLIHQVIDLGERALHRIPMVNRVYRVTQEVLAILFSTTEAPLKKAVLVPFPYDRAYTVGLAMGTLSAKESPLGRVCFCIDLGSTTPFN